MKLDHWEKLAKENHNRRYDVGGQVEIGDDGFLEVCLLTKKGGQIIHLHRYPIDGKGKEFRWDCWVFDNDKKTAKRLSMIDTTKNDISL